MNQKQEEMFNQAIGIWSSEFIKKSDKLEVIQRKQCIQLQYIDTGETLRSWVCHSHLTEQLQQELKENLVVIECSFQSTKLYYLLVDIKGEDRIWGAAFYTFDEEHLYRFHYLEGWLLNYLFTPGNVGKKDINGKNIYAMIVKHLKELPEYRLYDLYGMLEVKHD